MAEKNAPAHAPNAVEPRETKVRWETSSLKSSYANVCTASSTREEFVLNFGINHGWERGQQEIEIQLTDRIILSPFAAKRMSDLLARLIMEYEARYGVLNVEQPK